MLLRITVSFLLWLLLFICLFETKAPCVAQADLQVTIVLSPGIVGVYHGTHFTLHNCG